MADATELVQGLGISSPRSARRGSRNDDVDVLAFAKRLLAPESSAPATTTDGPPSSPPSTSAAPAIQRTVSHGKRPLFTRDHSRTSSAGSVRSLRNRGNNGEDDVQYASTSGAASAGPASPISGVNGTGGEGSPRKLRLLASSMSRRQPSHITASEEKKALAKLVTMYESLSQQVTELQTYQSDLETNLKIARSNLALAENHAEVLEDAIKRNSVQRLSTGTASPITGPSVHPLHGSRPNSVVSQGGGMQRVNTTRSPNPGSATLSAADADNDRDSPSTQAPSPRLGGFWRRRPTVGAATAQPTNGFPPSSGSGRERSTTEDPTQETAEQRHESLMRKPSFGMLRSSSANVPSSDKERTQAAQILQLQSQLAHLQHQYSLLSTEHTNLREKHAGLNEKYTSLQEEIENLSVSLFEEANNMVAEERRVNGFLGQQLEKAKEEVEELQQQLDALRTAAVLRQSTSAFSNSSGPSRSASIHSAEDAHSRRPSDTSSISPTNQRSRTGTVSSMHSHRRSVSSMNHKRRRSSTIPSLDAIDALVSASPRRASRDMAAAAAAVKALATRERERESLDMPRLPLTASAAAFQRVAEEDEDVEQREDRAKSAPQSATYQQDWSSRNSGSDGQKTDGAADETEQRASRSKWFSFGSLKRKSPALTSDVQTLSPALPSPNPSVLSDTNTVLDHSPRSPPARFTANVDFSTSLPRSPSSRSLAESSIPIRSASPRSRKVSQQSTSLRHSRGASSNSFNQSTLATTEPSLSPPSASTSKSDESGALQNLALRPLSLSEETAPSPRDRFFAAAEPLAALKEDANTGRDRADTSRSSQFASMTDLHSLLDEVANDIDLDVQKQAEALNGPLPFAATDQDSAPSRPKLGSRGSSSVSARNRRPLSWRMQRPPSVTSPLSPTKRDAVSPPLQAPASPTSPVVAASSPDFAAPASPPTLRPRRLRPIDTSGIRTSNFSPTYGDLQSATAPPSSGLEPSSPFSLPTPPPFKQFPMSNSFRAPLISPPSAETAHLPSARPQTSASSRSGMSSQSLARKDSLGDGLPSASSTSSSLNRFWETRKLGSFGLQRQNSTLSATGSSVVDDLDTLMQSIDAMNESLGLEDDPVLGETTVNGTLRSSDIQKSLGQKIT